MAVISTRSKVVTFPNGTEPKPGEFWVVPENDYYGDMEGGRVVKILSVRDARPQGGSIQLYVQYLTERGWWSFTERGELECIWHADLCQRLDITEEAILSDIETLRDYANALVIGRA